jgi:hypothetical protein
MSNPPPPYSDYNCALPPYNATNFTPANPVVYNTLVQNASNSPNYPWNTGTDSHIIYRSNQNISFFNNINQKTISVKTLNSNTLPYPTFKSETERLMYRQGMALTSARNIMTGNNPSSPAGVPCSTIYQIINS